MLVVGVYGKGGRRSAAFLALNQAIGGGLESLLKLQGWSGKTGDFVHVPAPASLRAKVLAVASLGERGDEPSAAVRGLATKVGATARKLGMGRIAFFLDPAMSEGESLSRVAVESITAGLLWGGYRFDRHLSKKEEHPLPEEVYLYHSGRKDRAEVQTWLERGAVLGRAQNLARDLVNEPANIVTPERLAHLAKEWVEARGVHVTILEEEDCRQRGMGAYLAVGQGSALKPKFVHMHWNPPGAKAKIALVGKALCFDSGGLCLKPADGQALMKMDMGGSAAVIGATVAIAELKIPVEVHAIFAATENMTGSRAYHTGDILYASNGKTIEVVNTDAEGRLTLADALHYACQLEPQAIVDLATLTGACIVGLGPSVAGIMGTGRALLRDLRAVGDATGEPMWELPMPDEYRELNASKVADLSNSGGRYGGAITAGMFLREFVKPEIPWAHIDIAGPCFVEKGLGGKPFGATGFPVRALVEWVSSLA
jgi:leucyl aminopeptidase